MNGSLMGDLRHAARLHLRAPAVTAVAVLALALGIGANTAIFSVVNAVLLRPLPFGDPERLVTVWEEYTPDGRSILTAREASAFAGRDEIFEDFAPLQQVIFTIRGDGEPEQLLGALASARLLPTLGVRPALGRGFTAEEDRGGAGQVVLISHELWTRRFGADPGVLGRSLTLDVDAQYGPTRSRRETFTVVGVLPRGFEVPVLDDGVELWAPLALDAELLAQDSNFLFAVGRLRPGVTVERAQRELRRVSVDVPRDADSSVDPARLAVVPLTDVVVGDVRPALLVLLGAVGFVLLTACANVANLLLARASARRREFAVRAALGARPRRLLRQLAVESLLLALAGGVAGLLLAYWGTDALRALAPEDLPRIEEVGLDLRVLLFTLGVSLLTAILFGLAPALAASRPELRETLQEGGRALRGERRGGRLRSVLVVSEVALALLLLVGAGLLLKSFVRLAAVEPGFEPRNALAAQIALPRARYEEGAEVETFYRELLRELEGLPGVRSAATVSSLPMSGWNTAMPVLGAEGRAPPAPGETWIAGWRSASPSYFRTMGMRVLRGRPFGDADLTEQPQVVAISQAAARRFWPGADAIGKRIQLPVGPDEGAAPWLTVVAVVSDVIYGGPDVPTDPMVYFPSLRPRTVDIVVRTGGDPTAVAGPLRALVQRLDPSQPVANVESLATRLERATAGSRFNAFALALFAALALVLAAIGIYGLVAYAVAQRTHEIGIRVALGARRADVLRLILGRGLLLTATGVGLGLAGALALSRVLSGLLYGVSARDPLVFGVVAVVLALVAVAASGVPALRASRLDPVAALREE